MAEQWCQESLQENSEKSFWGCHSYSVFSYSNQLDWPNASLYFMNFTLQLEIGWMLPLAQSQYFFSFFSRLHSALWGLHSVPVCSQDLLWLPWPIHCYWLTLSSLEISSASFLTSHPWDECSSAAFHTLIHTCSLASYFWRRVSTAQMSVMSSGNPLPLGPLSLRLCSAACGASGHRAIPSWRKFRRRLGIQWQYLPFMGIRDKLRNFKQYLFSLWYWWWRRFCPVLANLEAGKKQMEDSQTQRNVSQRTGEEH